MPPGASLAAATAFWHEKRFDLAEKQCRSDKRQGKSSYVKRFHLLNHDLIQNIYRNVVQKNIYGLDNFWSSRRQAESTRLICFKGTYRITFLQFIKKLIGHGSCSHARQFQVNNYK
jgi:hypothetical protein